MDVLTVRGAASRLRISRDELIALLEEHTLLGEQLPDGQWLISTESLRAYRQYTADTGRPWSTTTSWAALAELDGLPAVGVSSSTAHQLRRRLRNISPPTLARKLSRRSVIHRYAADDLDHLATKLLLTGPSAMYALTAPSPSSSNELHGYLADPRITIDDFAEVNHLTRRIEGNVRLYDRPDWVGQGHIGPATTATDTANSDSDADRRAGLNALADIQDRWMTGRGVRRGTG